MQALIRREYRLNGLCCPRCGEAIRQDAASLSGVVRAELDFSSQRLVLSLEDNELLTGLAPALAKLVAKHEPGVEILELPPPGYRTLHLSQTLPEEVVTSLLEGISRLPGLAGASLAGQGKEIRLEAERDGVPAPTLRAARTRVTTSCPGVRVSNRHPPGQAEGAGRGEFYRRLRLGLAIPLFVAAFLVPAWVAPLVFTATYL
ncbi:MAG: hypothetical protein LBU79_08380, partial [Planctomycetota bacterium]|nr:hypothetical protein [Planctomycetota bacterium]